MAVVTAAWGMPVAVMVPVRVLSLTDAAIGRHVSANSVVP
jgi:hypothetical protein